MKSAVAETGTGRLAGHAARPREKVPDIVERRRSDVDWDGFLPLRAHGGGWRIQQWIKRVTDVVVAGGGLVALLPSFALIAALVRLGSRGPVLYEWRVVGERGRPFVGYKFRTMVLNADEMKGRMLEHNEMRGPVFKMKEDPRVTRIGRWLRKFSLDELPQLWSVLKGDMSLVGPRPPLVEEFARFKPWHCGKLAVKPGITCLWQVNGRSEIEDFDQWAALDLKYIAEWNLWLDFKILLRTIPAVLRGNGAY